MGPVAAPVLPAPSTAAPISAPDSSTGSSGPTAASAPINSTTQTIWQVQAGGCLSGCEGITQLQGASQQNLTVHATPSASGPTSGPPSPPISSSTSSSITQLQIGCQEYCFADGAVPSVQPTLPVSVGAVAQLLSDPAALQQLLANPAGLQELLSGPSGLDQLLPALSPLTAQLLADAGLITPRPGIVPPIAGDTTVNQTSSQVQTGGSGAASQVQLALQDNSNLVAPPAAGASLSDSSAAGVLAPGNATNQTLQGIWQLQVGCIFYCTHTQQVQVAAQTNTVVLTGTATANPASAVVNTAVLRIWQLQIGCLFWCYATIQVQTASTDASVVVVPVASPSGSGSDSAPGPSALSGSGASSSAGSPPSGSSAGAVAAPGPGGNIESPPVSGQVASPVGAASLGLPAPVGAPGIEMGGPAAERRSLAASPAVQIPAAPMHAESGPPAARNAAGPGPSLALDVVAGARQPARITVLGSAAGMTLPRLAPIPRVLFRPLSLRRSALPRGDGVALSPVLLILAGAGLVLLAIVLFSVLKPAAGRPRFLHKT